MPDTRDLAPLREAAHGWARLRAHVRHRLHAGLPADPGSGAKERVRLFRPACSPEALAQVGEALADAVDRKDRPGRTARLAGLRALLVESVAEGLDPGAAQAFSDGWTTPLVQRSGDPGLHGREPACQVLRELAGERDRSARARSEEALADALGGQDGVRAAAWSAAQESLAQLGEGDADAAACALFPGGWAQPADGPAKALDPGAAARLCEELLAATDPFAQELLPWLLEREEEGRTQAADRSWHDLLHFLHAPRCAGAFPRGEQLRVARRWGDGLRLDLTAGGALRTDVEERPQKQLGASVEPVDPPEEVRLSWLPAAGPHALAELLAALSRGLLRAGPPRDAPPEDFLCTDPALLTAVGALFGGLVREPGFQRRVARADLPLDDQRAVAVQLVVRARLAAARGLAELEGLRSGLGSRTAGLHRDLVRRAAGVELPRGLALVGLDPLLSGPSELRGLALAARVRTSLRDRFDEDWWRNPAALPALRGLWARGGRPTVRELWQEAAAPGDGAGPRLAPLLAEIGEALR